MKKITILAIILFSLQSFMAQSQNYIKLFNEEILLTDSIEIDSLTISFTNPKGIYYKNSSKIKTVNKNDVDYIESSKGELIYYYKTDTREGTDITTIPKTSLKNLIKKGNNVYVPLANEQNDITNRYGNSLLRDFLVQQKYWNVVRNKKEAHFIMEYVFSEVGRDNAKIIIYDKFGKRLYVSGLAGATSNDPREAASMSVNKLCERIL